VTLDFPLGRAENSSVHGAHPASPEPKRSAVVTCILNDAAGSGHLQPVRRRRREAAEAQLIRIAGEHGARVQILRARGGSELLAFAAQAVNEQSNPVVAGGGDGTVNAVATKLVGTGTALGVLPLGSLNHFSKDAGIPQDVEQAVSTIFTGRVTAVDVGEVNDRIFMNNSSLGTYPEVVRMRQEEQRHGQGKWAALVHAWISALRHDAQLHIRLREGGEEVVTPLLFVGNNRYEIVGRKVGSRSALDAGHLFVCTAPRASKVELLRMGLRALLGRITYRDLSARDVTEFTVYARERRIDVATDGEVTAMATPLHYRCRPRALAVIVPRAKGA
jgi:diacylglycerol kinase family enzyme